MARSAQRRARGKAVGLGVHPEDLALCEQPDGARANISHSSGRIHMMTRETIRNRCDELIACSICMAEAKEITVE